MENEIQDVRRQILKGGLAAVGLGALGIPEWVLPALAQGDTVVPFTDLPAQFPAPRGETRQYDIRTVDGQFTPKDAFFTTQHMGHPVVDPATFELKVTGLVNKPLSLSLDALKKMRNVDFNAGFECSGNRRPLQGLSGNGRWTGVQLRAVLADAGIRPEAREFVFFGADHASSDVEWRTQKFPVDQQFGRSLTREQALSPEVMVVHSLNGEPLTRHQGSPLRLIVPGWYGVANVKWLSQIHLQNDAYLGNYQARWYRTLKGEMINGEMKWIETAITRMRLKSFVARVTRNGSQLKALVIVLNDGTPLKTVEVKVDEGPWQAAVADPLTAGTANKYSWKYYTYTFNAPAAGEHTLVSRATDTLGNVQPTAEALADKKSFLEDNSQQPRKVMVS
ncbi:MAG TPA: molybdopterin-dependent oxidoreductase [Vicinamibacterales bacterium]|nr:molybdopterin-dependent oxidoreductase [Vicinamibacterales bacterium]